MNITAATITVTGDGSYALTKAYDGTTDAGTGTGDLAISGKVDSDDVSVAVKTVGAYADANVNTIKTVTLTLELAGTDKGNYALERESYEFTKATIVKGTYGGEGIETPAASVNIMINKDAEQTGTLTVTDFFASDAPAGAKILSVTSKSTGNNIFKAVPTVADGVLSYTSATNLATKDLTDTYDVTIETANYENITATMTVKTVSKLKVDIGGDLKVDGLNKDNTIIYTGSNMTMSGTPTAPGVPATDFEYTWYKKGAGDAWDKINTAPKNAGSYKLVISIKEDNADYMGSKEILVVIAKKDVTVSVKNLTIDTGSTLPIFALTYDGLLGADSITLTPSPLLECKKDGIAVDGKTAGTYDIVWTNRENVAISGDENYNVILPAMGAAKGTLTVTTPSSGGGSGGSGGSGGGISSGGGSSSNGSTVTVDGKTENMGNVSTKDNTTTVTVDEAKISDKVAEAKNGSSVVIPVNTSSDSAAAQLVVKSVEEMAKKNMTLTVQAKGVTYELPATAVDTAGVIAQLGATDTTKVAFTITVTQEKNVKVDDATLIGTPVSFTVTADYNGKSVSVDHFSAMVPRSIEITKEQAGKITTAVVVENGKIIRHIPTDVYEQGGKYYAKINSVTNSIYVLIANESVFTDVTGKWYEAAANEISAREVTKGVFGTTFEGEKNINRAEFAALLVNAFGLPQTEKANFADVAFDAWYAKSVATAAKYGIVKGIDQNHFAPDATITRQEAMLMIQRAATFAAFSGGGSSDSTVFPDRSEVSEWAKDGVTFNLDNGLIIGMNGKINPIGTITRAETATVLLRLLQKAELIDVRANV